MSILNRFVIILLCWTAFLGQSHAQPAYTTPEAARIIGEGRTALDTDRLWNRNRIWAPARSGSIKVIGDSMLEDYAPISGWGKDITSQLMTLPNWKGRASVSNEAVASARAADFAANAPFLIDGWRCDAGSGLALVMLGQNDIGTRTAAQLKADLSTVWAALRSAGRKVVAYVPPRVGNASGTPLAVREEVWTWIPTRAGIEYDFFVYLGDLTEANTTGDSIHLNPAGNQIGAERTDAAAGPFFPADLRTPGQRYQGPVTVDRQSLYVPGINIVTDPIGGNLETDVYRPLVPGIRVDGVPYFPFPFPTGRGISVGQSAMTQATLASSISLPSSFAITAWVRLGIRHSQASVNHAAILGSSANDMFYLSGSGSSGSSMAIRPVLRIGGTDYTMPGTEVLTARIGQPVFVAVYRNSGQIYLCLNGVWAWAGGNVSSLTLNRLGWRDSSATSTWLGGEFLGASVKTWTTINTFVYRDIEYIMRGGDPAMTPGTTEAVWDFMPGDRLRDRSGNGHHIDLSAATSWSFINPLGRPDEGVSADNGDASVTLSTSTSLRVQRWATALTAPQTVTLSTTGAGRGAVFRLLREATATGASSLTVGTTPSKVLAAGEWCDAVYDGSSWRPAGAGSL